MKDPESKIDTRSRRQDPTLSTRGFLLSLGGVCLIPIGIVMAYTAVFTDHSDPELPVSVQVTQRLLDISDSSAMMQDVIVFKNDASYPISHFQADINGQYHLYQQPPLQPDQELVIRQAAFKTKSNQAFIPGRYKITKVTVMGKLDTGRRGVSDYRWNPSGEAIKETSDDATTAPER
ncbi:MAG: hypothetical protein AAFP90_10185 [Planctomycetota bacterium]